MRASLPAETLFVRMLALTKHTATYGVIYEAQLVLISHKIRNVRSYVEELVRLGILIATRTQHENARQQHGGDTADARQEHYDDTDGASWRIDGYTKWYGQEHDSNMTATREPSISAGQEPASRARTREREREKEREREEPSRPPTGTGREGSARAVPLAGGAAARHAQLMDIRAPWDPPEADTVDTEHVQPSDENAALIKAAIQKGYQSSNSKGQPAKLWKYPRELHSTDPEVRAALQTAKRNTDDPIRPALSDIVEQLAKLGISDEQMGLSGDSE